MTFAEILGLLALGAGAWYWFDAMRAKEIARRAGRQRCEAIGVIFLDESVVRTRLWLRRDRHGRAAVFREFQFEFTSDGARRYGGELTMLGRRVERIDMEPYRVADH